MNRTFLPEGYSQPKQGSGGYLKLQEGANKFRVLGPAITGWEVWTVENKPVRFKDYPERLPSNMRPDSKPKFFWAFPVWNYRENAVQIFEITQATIQGAMNDLMDNVEWGDPQGYDLTINRKGEKLDTEYTVQPSPHKPVEESVKQAFEEKVIELEALFEGANPFDPDWRISHSTPF